MQHVPNSQTTCLITGAASGIGMACLERLLDTDRTVVAVDLRVEALRSLQGSHANLEVFECDLSRSENCESLFAALDERDLLVSELINSAGAREIVPVTELSSSQWQQIIAVNLTAPFVLAREMARRLSSARQHRGAIVNIASVSGLMAEPQRAAYVSSKHGLVGLTKQLAMEFGPLGLRVNAVAPGVVETEMTKAYFSDPQMVDLILANHCIGRWGQVDDIANAVDFLLSDKSSFMTGSIVTVDGGWTAGKRL